MEKFFKNLIFVLCGVTLANVLGPLFPNVTWNHEFFIGTCIGGGIIMTGITIRDLVAS